MVDPTLEDLLAQSIELKPEDWNVGVVYTVGEWPAEDVIIICFHAGLGYYLKVIQRRGRGEERHFLSRGTGPLDEVVEAEDEWYASKGLFIPKEKARKGIVDFYVTQQPSPELDWIDPSEIPEGGNY